MKINLDHGGRERDVVFASRESVSVRELLEAAQVSTGDYTVQDEEGEVLDLSDTLTDGVTVSTVPKSSKGG